MAKMRTTTHNSRTNAAGRVHGTKHNDRNFDVTKADNIDPERVKLNEYRNCYNDPTIKFTDAELRFYNEHFKEQLEKTNEKYIKNRHPERVKTMEQFKASKQYCPEETTYQIGKMEEHADAEKLKAVYESYRQKLEAWNEEHGRPFTTLTSALHVDEDGAPHYQDRRVWHYRDEDGTLKIGQEKALEATGIDLPDPKKKMGRRNNRKMVFDKMARGMWLDCCHEHGLDVEREALPDGKKHNKDKEDMIREKYQAVLDENERLSTQNKELTTQNKTLSDENKILSGNNETLSNENKTLSDENKDLKTKNEQITEKLDEANKDLKRIKENYSEWQDDLLDLQAKVLDLEDKIEGREQDYKSLDKEASDLEEKINDLINQHEDLLYDLEDVDNVRKAAIDDKNKAVDDYNAFLGKFNDTVDEYNDMQNTISQYELIEARKVDLSDVEAPLKKPLMGEAYYQVPAKDWEAAVKMSNDYSKMESKVYKTSKQNEDLQRDNERMRGRINNLIKEKQDVESKVWTLEKDNKALRLMESALAEFCDKFKFLSKWKEHYEEYVQRKEQERLIAKWQKPGQER